MVVVNIENADDVVKFVGHITRYTDPIIPNESGKIN